MHFGLDQDLPYILYVSSILAFFLTVFWRPVIGIYFLLPLIPLQTLRYRLNDLPLGQSVVGILLLAVVLGLWWRGQLVLPRTPWTKFLCGYAIFTFVSLCLGSFYLGRSLPFPGDSRFSDWQGYITMPAILLLVAAVEPTGRQMKAMILLMCLAAIALDRNFWDVVSGRDFSSFSYDLRDEGGMGYAGVNGLGAFEAQVAILLLALAAFERKRLLQLGYIALAILSALCLMYTFSRGGYLALLFGWLFLGLVKQRKLLLVLALFVGMWTSLVPPAVQQRVLMTYDETSGQLDHSAATRVNLWHEAMQVFDTNPLVGVGFDTYAYTEHLSNYKDTHNIYVKVLVETGVLGLFIFLWLLAKTFVTSYGLFRKAKDPFLASLGLGLAGWVVCSFVANCFGDRWMYLQVNGYMWILGGLVSRALVLEENAGTTSIEDQSPVSDSGAGQEVPQPAGAM
jgi:putative inorganic carbon (HCO3(-)) transporter